MKSIGYKDLGSIDFLKDIDENSLHDLFHIARQRSYDVGNYIVREGEKADTAFLVVRGTAEVFKKDANANKQILVLLGPGDIIGLGDKLEFHETWKRSADIIALEPMILYEFEVKDYVELVKKRPSLVETFSRISHRMSYYLFIRQLFPFAAFNYRKIRIIADILKKKEISKDVQIITEKNPSDTCYFILDGEVEISVTSNGTKKVLKTLGKGEIIGEGALLGKAQRTASVTTLTDCTFLEVKGEDLKKIIYQYPDFSKYYSNIVHWRMRPKKHPYITASFAKGANKFDGYTLKNPKNSKSYQLSDQSYFIWNLLDGEYTIPDLNEKFVERYGTPADDYVTQTIFDLLSQGFIEDPALALNTPKPTKVEEQNGFWASIQYFFNQIFNR